MNRLESWLLYVSTVLLTATGLVYAAMHYLMKPVDPFAVVNHPWEPFMRSAHIVIAPALVLAVGLVAHSHILMKLQNGSRTARKSGILLIPLFVVMVCSGYFLQVVTSEMGRKILVLSHLISGALWFGSFVAHQIASLALRRTMGRQQQRQEALRNGRLQSKMSQHAPLS